MRAALAAAVALLLVAPAAGQAAPRLTPIGSFDQPVHVAGPPGDPSRLFVVEKTGRVQVLVNGQKAAAPFLDLTGTVNASGERGLLSIAFAPDYVANGRFFVFYTLANGDLVVAAGARSAADPNRGVITGTVFSVPHPGADNHNGGQLAFGPDGFLYVSTGDGGGQGDPGDDAQRTDSLLGKILRVEPRAGATPAIWALGLRNPWRFSFDRLTGEVLIGDVGGSLNEEIDLGPPGVAGRNYGWNRCEGASACAAGFVPPVLNLPRDDGFSGVIGGFVVRDPGVPSLVGRYLFGDRAKPTLLSAVLGAGPPRAEPSLPISGVSSLGEDGCGRVYAASLEGPVSRIEEGDGTVCTGGVATPAPSPPTGGGEPTNDATVRCGLRVRAPHAQRAGRIRLRLRAARACVVTLRSPGFRLRRVALVAGRARIVRITPRRTRLRRLERATRGDRRVRVRVRLRARTPAGVTGTRVVRARVR